MRIKLRRVAAVVMVAGLLCAGIAKAFAPAVIPLAIEVATAVEAPAAVASGWASIMGWIGAAFALLYTKDLKNTTDPTTRVIAIPLKPSSVLPAPTGVANSACVTSPSDPTWCAYVTNGTIPSGWNLAPYTRYIMIDVPTGTPVSPCFGSKDAGCFDSATKVFDVSPSFLTYYQFYFYQAVPITGVTHYWWQWNGSSWSYSTGTTVNFVCGAGYKFDKASGSCLLSNARAAKSDNRCDIGRDGNKFTDLGDIDCAAATGKIKPVIGTNTVSTTWYDDLGKPMARTVTILDDGTEVVTDRQQTQDDSGAQKLAYDVATFDPLGKLKTVAQWQTNELLTVDTSGKPQATDPNGNPSNNITGEQPGNSNIQFPTDYARDQTIKDLTATEAPPDEPKFDDTKIGQVFFKDTFTPLLSWRLPSHTSQCPALEMHFTYWSKPFDYVVTSHCDLMEGQRDRLSLIMVAVWLVAGLFVVLEA